MQRLTGAELQKRIEAARDAALRLVRPGYNILRAGPKPEVLAAHGGCPGSATDIGSMKNGRARCTNLPQTHEGALLTGILASTD